MDNISFRPHHFMCTLCFQGKGYSPDFIRNYKNIVKNLTDETPIHVTEHTDSICAPCPHKRELKCASQEKIASLDKSHAEVLKLQPDETLTWAQAKERIKKHMTLEKFHKICEPCSWKSYGLCESVLTKFLGKTS
jgi:uncharacterized protein